MFGLLGGLLCLRLLAPVRPLVALTDGALIVVRWGLLTGMAPLGQVQIRRERDWWSVRLGSRGLIRLPASPELTAVLQHARETAAGDTGDSGPAGAAAGSGFALGAPFVTELAWLWLVGPLVALLVPALLTNQPWFLLLAVALPRALEWFIRSRGMDRWCLLATDGLWVAAPGRQPLQIPLAWVTEVTVKGRRAIVTTRHPACPTLPLNARFGLELMEHRRRTQQRPTHSARRR